MPLKGMNMAIEVKTIGSSGQISFGKQHAGRTVTVEEIEKGVWLVKAARVIPENELWLHSAPARRTLDRAVARAAENPTRSSDLNKLEAKLKKRR
jgi:hypothetical protein